MTIHRRLIERNLSPYRPLRHLPFTPAHCRARLQSYLARSGCSHADWGPIVFSDESRFQLCPEDHRGRVCRTSLVVIRGTLTAQQYVDDSLRAVSLPFLLQYSGFIFSKILNDHI
ncbi:transposable element Tc1 transposase [Trichonephila clavipes]|nr:transposable element Tc1 transposase [Trichonephila clavipes]